MSDDNIEVDFDEINHTELVKLCHWVGMPNVSRAIPRDMIIQTLEQLDVIDIHNPVDKKREELSNWMKRYWSVLEMQVRKSECPDCTLCGDLQVVECHTDNKKHFKRK